MVTETARARDVPADSPSLDGVRMAVLSNRFEGIVRAMMNTLFRTGRCSVAWRVVVCRGRCVVVCSCSV